MLPSVEECAAAIYFGTWLPLEQCPDYLFAERRTPEFWLLQKETLSQLSEEGRVLVDILVGLPTECFTSRGTVKKITLRKICRELQGWTDKETDLFKEELRLFLKSLNPAARNRRV